MKISNSELLAICVFCKHLKPYIDKDNKVLGFCIKSKIEIKIHSSSCKYFDHVENNK